nr:odorant receptor 42 [Podabrus annulatus]
MNSRPILPIALKLFSFVSLNPLNATLTNRIFSLCTVVVTLIVWFDVFLVLASTYHGIDSIMEVLIFLVYSQIIIKMFVIMVNKKEILTLINNTNKFWKKTPYDIEQHERNGKIFKFVTFCVRSYMSLLIANCVVYHVRPLFHSGIKELPWKSICSKFSTYRVCAVFEAATTTPLVFINLGVDVMYVGLITNIICELKLVKNYLPNLKINPKIRGADKEAMDELKKLIDHHNLILETIKILKYVYRVPLLGLFTSNMLAMCFSLILLTSRADHSTKVQFGMLMMFYLLQLSFYCITGSLLADESTSVSDEAYKAEWYVKTQPELRNAVLMVILRSNKPEIVTAGGFIDVDLITFTVVLKSCFSFFTFMQLMYQDSEDLE